MCYRESIHDIGHTLGLWHEQSTSDRDDHIRIIPDNIDPKVLGMWRLFCFRLPQLAGIIWLIIPCSVLILGIYLSTRFQVKES
jgi:hypothetical protein